MTSNRDDVKPRGGLPGKRRAILSGALTVFARDGYRQASIDTISAEAGVSTRTIYNHFQDKAQLFQTVIQYSTRQVADIQVAIIDRHLSEVTDLEPDLIELGKALATPITDHAEHFALVRQLNACAEHVPEAVLELWREAGPRRVLRELGRHLQHLADRGLLRIDDSDRAATQFMLLVQGAIPFHHGVGANREADVSDIVTSGVRTFLYGYAPPSSVP